MCSVATTPSTSRRGVRAYHRWLHDTFGSRPDRILLVGMSGTAYDMDAVVAELEWLADRDFAGTYIPGFLAVPGIPPLFDDYWEPVWNLCEAPSVRLFVHVGHGVPYGGDVPRGEADQGRVLGRVRHASDHRGDDRRPGIPLDFLTDIRARRPIWQLMLGGVFDRHPDLRLVMTEAMLPTGCRRRCAHSTRCTCADREAFPAKHSPTEYWHSHCMTSLSFVHRSEIAMRYELGVETLGFGRDYPHNEATWPNTKAWLRDVFASVPEGEVRLMLGENVIRFLDLDRARLAAIADEIGPSWLEIRQ